MRSEQELADFLAQGEPIAEIRVTHVRGSSPRDAGATMFVSAEQACGTIGGGQLEFNMISAARSLLSSGGACQRVSVPLGPDIGQCCGGNVDVEIRVLGKSARAQVRLAAQSASADWPHVYIFGAGHVGRALAESLNLLPLRVSIVDSRQDEIARCPTSVKRRLTALPEAEITQAQPGSAFVVMTHNHGLDFMLTLAALSRGDAAYVGMIGSASKRAQFLRFAGQHHAADKIEALICPIGTPRIVDKRPEIIAALVTAELIAALARHRETGTRPRQESASISTGMVR